MRGRSVTARGYRRRSSFALGFCVLPFVLEAGPLSAAPWIVFTEIHYHPREGSDLEFVELFNLEAPRVDLSGWSVDGEVRFCFPPGTVLPAHGHLVVAANPEALSRQHPSLTALVGPFEGKLDNKGGRVVLRTPTGAVAAAMRYSNTGDWTAIPDGTGYTLVIQDPFFDLNRPESWRPSLEPGGTPGYGFADVNEKPVGEPLVREGETWRFFRGRREPPRGWQSTDFDDSGWETGPSGFGYGDDDDGTVLADMPGRYLSVYTRRTFEVDDPEQLGQLVLRIDYDDGFVAYLNGEEIARSNLGPAGSVVTYNTPAMGSREAGTVAESHLGPATRLLREGENTLAVQAHNRDLTSTDLSLIVELWSRELEEEEQNAEKSMPPRLNEVSLAGDWLEIFNPSDREVDLSGYFLSDDPRQLRKAEIGAAPRIPPGGFLVLKRPGALAGLSLATPDLRLFLTAPDGRVVDAWRFLSAEKTATKDKNKEEEKSTTAEEAESLTHGGRNPESNVDRSLGIESRGRFPDGSASLVPLEDATPGRPNRRRSEETLVINEIMYHPMAGLAGDEYVEIFNTGSETVELTGFSLRDGIHYDFESGASIAPRDYLVVARNPAALTAAYGLAADRVVGPYRGGLSNGGERVTLVGPPRGAFPGRLVDSVAYADGAPWPGWADGTGCSLELVDPESDNSLPQAWAASDEAGRSVWQSFEYAKELRPARLTEASSLQFMLLDAGECLIDDVRLTDARGGVIIEDSFDGDGGKWTTLGTHGASRVRDHESTPGSTAQSARRGRCLALVAEGRGNPRHNYVSLRLPKLLDPGRVYKVSFRARWLRGSPLLLSRTAGHGLAQVHRLAVVPRPGTPGRRNSRYAPSPPPLVGVPEQTPVAPSSRQAVTISVPISSRASIPEALIFYRPDGSAEWRSTPLVAVAEGGHRRATIWKGTIPALGHSSVLQNGPALRPQEVEYYLSVRDEKGLVGTFPREAPAQTALYAVDLPRGGRFPTYTVLVSDREWQAFRRRQTLSNRTMDATLVYGDSRIFYNVGFRLRGSPFTRGGRNWRLVFGAETLDGRKALTFDGQGTNSRERLTYWLLGALHVPTSRLRYVQVNVPGQPGESGIYEEVEKVDEDFLARWFDDAKLSTSGEALGDAGGATTGTPSAPTPLQNAALQKARFPKGLLHKVDDHWELLPPGEHRVRSRGFFGTLFGSRQRAATRSYVEAFFNFTSSDPEDYRWNFPPRANGTEEDFEPLVRLVRLLDPRQTPDDVFVAEVEKQVNVDQWLRVLAVRTAVNDWDSIGRERGKNAYLYRSPHDERWYMIPWDADLSWATRSRYSPFRTLFSRKFLAVRRLLTQPAYRRQFLSYLSYVMERKFDAGHFTGVLSDLRRRTGRSGDGMLDFATASREWFSQEIAKIPDARLDGPIGIERVERLSRTDGPDIVRLSGIAPLIVQRFALDGRVGVARFRDDQHWTAEFPVGSDGGTLRLRALDFDGLEIDSRAVEVPTR